MLDDDLLPHELAGVQTMRLMKTLAAFAVVAPISCALGASTTVYGTINGYVNIIIVSTNVDPASVRCTATLDAIGADASSASNTVAATVSGNTAVCKYTINYQWALQNPSNDTMSVTYSVTALNTNGIGATSYSPAASFLVPANGTTTYVPAYTRL